MLTVEFFESASTKQLMVDVRRSTQTNQPHQDGPMRPENVEYATVEARIIREIGGDVKTQISYKKLDGANGVALVNGEVSSTLQAKHELAGKLDAPAVDEPHGEGENIDARLRNFGIDPGSVQHLHISE